MLYYTQIFRTEFSMDTKDLKVLIADDMTYMRINIEKIIRKLNIREIIHAEDGEKALEVFNQFDPHLIIVDLALAKVHIFHFINLLAKMNKHSKIIICTSRDNDDLIEKALEQGAAGFFYKPLKEDELLETMKKVIKQLFIELDEKEQKASENIDFTKKFNIDLDVKQKLVIFNLFKTFNDFSFDDIFNAVIAFQVYRFTNIFLNFENMSECLFEKSELAMLKDTVEGEGGKFIIISENKELNKKLLNTELSSTVVATLAHAQGKI